MINLVSYKFTFKMYVNFQGKTIEKTSLTKKKNQTTSH